MLYPAFPNLPIGADWVQSGVVDGQPGTTKAAGSKKRFTVRSDDERLPLAMRSGAPPIVPVPEGSNPAKVGEKYCPLCTTAVQVVRHPPSMRSTARGVFDKKCCPLPTGKTYRAWANQRLATTRRVIGFLNGTIIRVLNNLPSERGAATAGILRVREILRPCIAGAERQILPVAFLGGELESMIGIVAAIVRLDYLVESLIWSPLRGKWRRAWIGRLRLRR